MKITETLYVTNHHDWRDWLEKNHDRKKEIWLLYYKKETGKARIPQADAVEEALCFGWIDSTVKKFDKERFAQRFTPRNPKSVWSDINRARVRKLIKENRMTEAGRKVLKGSYFKRELRVPNAVPLPSDFESALKNDAIALRNFQKLAPSYKKMYAWYIISAKQKETRKRRIKKALKNARLNNKFVNM